MLQSRLNLYRGGAAVSPQRRCILAAMAVQCRRDGGVDVAKICSGAVRGN